MSNFPQNLSILRRQAGYTQESLAEALDVSRQAVSKWESGQTLPEAATLLQLADLLNCSLDQLMREALTEEALALSPESSLDGDRQLYAAWAAHMDRFALMMALGVTLILLGIAAMLTASAFFGEHPLVMLPFLVCLIAAVFLFVVGGIAHGDFQRACPRLPDCCDPAERETFQRMFRLGIAGAIAGVLVNVTLLVILLTFFPGGRGETLAVALFLALLALCVGTIVYLGILMEKYEPERCNAQKKGPDISGAIMLTATGIYLLLGFTQNLWHPGWVVFPIGGILCAIVDSLRRK